MHLIITTTTTTKTRKRRGAASSSCCANGLPHPMNVFSCPLQLQPLFRDRLRVSRVPAGGTSGDCVAFPIVDAGAARGRVGALICHGGAAIGSRELLLLLVVEEGVLLLFGGRVLLLLLLVVVVVVVGASPILH